MLVDSLNWAVIVSSWLNQDMISVERVLEYSNLNAESDWESKEDFKPSTLWPTNGKIDFVNYSTIYREGLDPVLKNLSVTIKGGEKVGVVGRTGAGKSSMTLALFRIIEPTSGTIIIDGVDVTKIGLHDLRSKLTIIPQEPSLFAGAFYRVKTKLFQ
jgi:ABC-type multidrug transport system fused ATPase/permease subunit